MVGAGGQGKTRLARHLAGQVTGEGWATVVLGEHVGAADLTVLAEMAAPTLVIVDYAEGRSHQLAPLIQALDRAEAKVRRLLLARTAGAWRTERVNPAPQLAVLADDQIVVNLRPVEPTPAGREQAWHQAVAALAPRLAGLDGHQHIPWTALSANLSPPRLAGERYRTILAVQMHALAALLQAGDPVCVGGRRDAREVLLDHESRYWTRVADRFGITLTPATRRCLVATATLPDCSPPPSPGPARTRFTTSRSGWPPCTKTVSGTGRECCPTHWPSTSWAPYSARTGTAPP